MFNAMSTTATRVILAAEPFVDPSQNPFHRGAWPAQWVRHPEVRGTEPAVVAYRRLLDVARDMTVRIHVSADERYELFLDGRRIGRGPERGDRHCWFFETHDLYLSAGPHTLVARVFWIGPDASAAYAQVTICPAFLLAAEGEPGPSLSTGVAAWECKRLGGYRFISPDMAWGTSAKTVIRGADYDWDHEFGRGEGWQAVKNVVPAHSAARTCMGPDSWMLRPALLPAMLEASRQTGVARHVQAVAGADTRTVPVKAGEHLAPEAAAWDRLLAGGAPLSLPAHTTRRVIVDLGDYYCAYPVLTLSGGCGASLRVHWAESLFEELAAQPGKWSRTKGNRNEIEGKFFAGVGDTFEHDGAQGRRYEPFWWEAGRYLEILVTTAEAPLTIDRFELLETHYPYAFTGRFAVPFPALTDLVPLATRVLEMCSHETYMDCPYYEQLMYVGDTRLEVLTTYTLTADDRLPRKAIRLYDESRGPAGLTQARYPCRVPQIIAPFSLYWVGMVHDFALWRDDAAFVRERLPGVRAVLDAFASRVNADGLLQAMPGWNFVDWVPEWGGAGMPADADFGISGIINWHLVYTLRLAAELEEAFGEPEFAARHRRLAGRIVAALERAFWDERRGVYADDVAHAHFSEHAQCFAILAGDRRTRLDAPGLARATIYFSHYLFEASRSLGQINRFFELLSLWADLKRLGFRTTVEMPEPSRSDCHAWGAHPIYHTFASVLGIRPAGFGFKRVRIEPMLGALPKAQGVLPHPAGTIAASFEIKEGRLRGTVELPAGVGGELLHDGIRRELMAGMNAF
jgi:hypothetical protein